MKLIRIIFALAAFLPVFSFGEAMVVGKGEYQYEDGIFKATPDETERLYAISKAKSNAILAYADTMPTATRRLFEEKRAQFLSNPDRYIVRYNMASDRMDKTTRLYSVVLEVYVDEGKIKNDIGDSFSGNKDAKLSKGNVAAFFVARSIASTTAYDARVTKLAKSEQEVGGAAHGSSSGGTTTAVEHSSQTTMTISGGSTVRKSDEDVYQIDEVSRGEFSGYLTDVFTEKGVSNILDGGFFDCMNLMVSDYGNGNNIKPATWRKIMKEMRDPENEVQYIVIGTVDMSAKGVHRASGKPLVSATVSAKIYSVKGKVPKIIASLRPITAQGIGGDQNLAKKSALNNCAKDAAEEIIDKLRVQGLL